ncbi:MAG TPA: GNAT family N-acetyltransferase [Caulobacteraceae bacterium]|jgi:GNAT superfamily N-acetyltransferase
MPFETRHRAFTLSDDPTRFDLPRGHAWIGGESYWGAGIPLAVFERSLRGSLTIGAYDPTGEMAAMARVVTDRATFGWICDVFVDQARRGQGLGKAIMAYFDAHPDLQGLRRLHLATRDAHGLYAQFGFGPLTGVEKWMERRLADPYGVSRARPSPPASAP